MSLSSIAKMRVIVISLKCAHCDAKAEDYLISEIPDRFIRCYTCGETSCVPAAALRLKKGEKP